MNAVPNYKELDVMDLDLELSDEKKLHLAGKNVTTIDKVLRTSNVELQSYGLTAQEVNVLKTSVSEYVPTASYLTVQEYASILATKWRHITFGCSALDKITRNGIPIRGITEIVGESGCGKSQICMQLALNVQLPLSHGGLEKSAVYICTEDAFPSKRLIQMAGFHSKKYQTNGWLDNIFIEHCPDSDKLLNCICNRLPLLMKQHSIGLIVVDSVAGSFRLESDAILRADHMRQFVLQLQTLADEHECAIVCVNQVTASMNQRIRNKSLPSLGLAWSNLVTSRFIISKLNKEIVLPTIATVSNTPIRVRHFEIDFSPELPNTHAEFIITEIGICDTPSNS